MTDKELAKVCKEYAPKFKAKYLDYFTKPHIYGIAPAEVIASLIGAEKKKPDHRKLRDRICGRLTVADMCELRLLQQLTNLTQQDIISEAIPMYVKARLARLEVEVKCANITT